MFVIVLMMICHFIVMKAWFLVRDVMGYIFYVVNVCCFPFYWFVVVWVMLWMCAFLLRYKCIFHTYIYRWKLFPQFSFYPVVERGFYVLCMYRTNSEGFYFLYMCCVCLRHITVVNIPSILFFSFFFTFVAYPFFYFFGIFFFH